MDVAENIESTAEPSAAVEESIDNESVQAQDEQTQPLDTPADTSANQESDDTPDSTPDSPEWFMKDKYKSVDEQARAAYELQKKMGKYWGNPKDNYSIEGIEGVTENDPLISGIGPALQEMGISQEGFKHLVGAYQESQKKMVDNFEAELKKALTEDDAHTYLACDKWMNENLSPEDKAQIQNSWLLSPQDFKLFNQLRHMIPSNSNVPSTMDNVQKFESSKEVENDKIKYRTEIKQGLRVKDRNYENELSQRFRDARARGLKNG